MTASTHDAPRTISRRRLVKTAAHAAWAVPAIQVVSAVPAFACSNPTGNFAFAKTALALGRLRQQQQPQVGRRARRGDHQQHLVRLRQPDGDDRGAPTAGVTTSRNDGTMSDHSTPTYSGGTWSAGAGKGPLTFTTTGTFAKGGTLNFNVKFRGIDWEKHQGDTLTVTVLCGGLSSTTTITV